MTAHFTNLQNVKYIKYYNLLFHLLKAVYTFQLANVPTIKSAGRTRLDRYYTIIDRLACHQAEAGGLRVEARIESTTLDDASSDYYRLWAFPNLLQPATDKVSYITVPQYFRNVREKMVLVDSILTRSGVARHHLSGQLILRQKRILGDLKSLFGYATHNSIKTDPISPIAW